MIPPSIHSSQGLIQYGLAPGLSLGSTAEVRWRLANSCLRRDHPHGRATRCTSIASDITGAGFPAEGVRQTRRTPYPACRAAWIARRALGSFSPPFVTSLTMVLSVPEEGSEDRSLTAKELDGTGWSARGSGIFPLTARERCGSSPRLRF